jgi:N-methylhydantoinase A
VIVPPVPGGFSALGLVASDLRRDYVKTFYATLAGAGAPELTRAWGELTAAAEAMLDRAGVPPGRREIGRAADLRYRRQAYELTVPVAPGPVTAETVARLAADFHEKHRMTYGHASPEEPIQVVNLRASAVGRLGGLDLFGNRRVGGVVAPGSRLAHFRESGTVRVDVLARDALVSAREYAGPVIIESMDTTVVVPPGWRGRADGRGFLTLERKP